MTAGLLDVFSNSFDAADVTVEILKDIGSMDSYDLIYKDPR